MFLNPHLVTHLRTCINLLFCPLPPQDAQLDALKESIDREILSGNGASLLGTYAAAVQSVCHSPALMQVVACVH